MKLTVIDALRTVPQFKAPLAILSKKFNEILHYHRDLLSVLPSERSGIMAKAKLEHEEALVALAVAEERKRILEEADNTKADMGSRRWSGDTLRTDASFDDKSENKAFSKAGSMFTSKRSGLSSLFQSCMGLRK